MELAAISTYTFSRRPVFVAFFLYAFALGTLFPRLGDLQLEMGLSESELGLSLIGLPLGVQLSLLVANRIISYLTLAQIMIFGLIMIVCSYTAAALVSEPSLFFLTLLMAGLSVGPLEVQSAASWATGWGRCSRTTASPWTAARPAGITGEVVGADDRRHAPHVPVTLP